MRNELADVLKNLTSIGFTELRVTGTEERTLFEGMTEKQEIVAKVVTNTPISEFVGEFGMTDLSVIKGLTTYSSFTEDGAAMSVHRTNRKGVDVPTEIRLIDTSGREASYRLVPVEIVAQQPRMLPINWDITFQPTKDKIVELQKMTSIFSTVDPTYGLKTVNGELRTYIGGEKATNHRTYVTLANGVPDVLTTSLSWGVSHLTSVLKLIGDSGTISIVSRGLMRVSYDTEYAHYDLYLPANKDN